ncbi:MAG TPA: hypothetical protein VH539_15585 [Gemmatimonadaceae bacterium]|jgi:hypothetical protein
MRLDAARFLDLAFELFGIDAYLCDDGRFAVQGPAAVVRALHPQILAIGRDAIFAELVRRDAESRARLAPLLSPVDHHAPRDDEAAD